MSGNTYIPSHESVSHFFNRVFTYIPSTSKHQHTFSSHTTTHTHEHDEHNTTVSLPLSIFRTTLSGLEAISLFLRDMKGYRYSEIAQFLNRDDSTIWGACKSAEDKMQGSFENGSGMFVPLSIFSDRTLSVLESLTLFLKDTHRFRYCDIARLVSKDQRTIWTVYKRAQKKMRKHEAA